MVQIHVWADYVCPFCLIADELIERATAGRENVQVVHHAYELRPSPIPTLRPEDAYLPTVWSRAVYPMAQRHGVQLRLPSVSPQPYTALAFRGAQHARAQGVGDAYHRRMLTAFFRDDLDIGDREVLAALAAEIGLERGAYLAALDDPATRTAHEAELTEAARLGITVVPTVMIGDLRIDGVPSQQAIVDALDSATGEAA